MSLDDLMAVIGALVIGAPLFAMLAWTLILKRRRRRQAAHSREVEEAARRGVQMALERGTDPHLKAAIREASRSERRP